VSKGDSKDDESIVTKIWIAFGLAFLAVVILYFAFVVTNAENFSQVTAEGFSGFGAFVGGVGGTLFSAIAAGLVYMAYSTQKKELANSVKALTETQRNQELQSNLSALTPVMTKIEYDFNRRVVCWFSEDSEQSTAEYDASSGAYLAAAYIGLNFNQPVALSEVQPLNPDNEDGFESPMVELLSGSISSVNYNGQKKLRFFLIQFIIQVTSAMQIVKNMHDNKASAHFYASTALLLEEVNQTLTCVFNAIAVDEEIPSQHAWCRNFLKASSDLDEVLNEIHSEK